MNNKLTALLMCSGILCSGVIAEPIVVHNDINTSSTTMNLADIDPSHPNLSFALDSQQFSGGSNTLYFRPVVIENGTECFGNFPGNLFPEVANIGYFNAAAGMTVDSATGSWVYTEPLCDVGSVLAAVKSRNPGEQLCQDGCWFESSGLAGDGVLYMPFRWHELGETDWLYGWSAFRVTEEFVGDCVFQCKPGVTDPMYTVQFTWLGAGYETEPDTGIVVGGGLCPADLNFDALLNFSDISEFLALYSSGDLGADMNNDGNLNFFDVSEMIGMFGGDCGL